MDSDLVIKVKYGNTLRRFNASTDLNMDALKAKILNLFKFSTDADMMITYIDEDNDVVTLGDDEDLCDAMGQRLNPLRINVLLNTSNRSGRSESRSQSGTSTPMKSARVQERPFNINTSPHEALKYVPEQFRTVLARLINDLTSKAASSVPPELKGFFLEFVQSYPELNEYFSDFVQSHPVPPSHGQDSAATGIPVSTPFSSMDLYDKKGPEASNDTAKSHMLLPNADLLDQLLGNNLEENKYGDITKEVGPPTPPSVTGAIGSVDLNLDPPRFPPQESVFLPKDNTVSAFIPLVWTDEHETKSQRECVVPRNGGSFSAGNQNSSSLPPPSDDLLDLNPHPSKAPKASMPPVPPRIPPYPTLSYMDDGTGKPSPNFGVTPFWNPKNFCPIYKQMEGDSYDVPAAPGLGFRFGDSFGRSYSHCHNMPRTFHRGVRCDGCGMHPIIGPRFKSKVKEDYDLCNICFSEMGNEADYTRIDRATYRSPRLFKEFYNHHHRLHGFRGNGMKPSRAKLESRFIQDVTILDGTLMAPDTPFTKIWKMRNNGTIPWPRHTQLVWIGGDQFGKRSSIELEIPENGCPVGSELDMAVDFTAPVRPGRYISYWRMASPSGQRFGQRVWVLIQVDLSQQDSLSESLHAALNLNLPAELSGQKGKQKGKEVIDVNMDPMDGSQPEAKHLPVVADAVEPLAKPPSKSPDFEFPVDLLIDDRNEAAPIPEMAAPVEYPIIDFSVPPSEPTPTYDAVPPEAVTVTEEANAVEETLLKELEEMGFKQIDLNKEILRMNEYNLEHSVDYLCGLAEWDPILEELQEMGFRDDEANRKLLIKNGGSIKRVVLDLIAGEKARDSVK